MQIYVNILLVSRGEMGQGRESEGGDGGPN